MKKAEEQYNERKTKYQSLITEQARTINLVSNLRLLVFIAGAGLGIYFFVGKNYGLFLADLILFLALFVFLVLLHERYFTRKKTATTLLNINEDSLKRIGGEWQSFPDDGGEFRDDDHPYAQDLDLFGRGSLFQMISTARTFLGRVRLKSLLLSPPGSLEEILARQEAVTDLAGRLDWRQQYQAEGSISSKMHDPQGLITWAGKMEEFYLKPSVIFAFRLIPVITLAIAMVTFLRPERSYYPLIAVLLIQFLLLKINGKRRRQKLAVTASYTENIAVYSRMLRLFETEQFDSPYIQGLQKRLQDAAGNIAYKQIGRLVRLAEAMSNRHNAFYVIFNILFLLDYQFMFALEKWKEKSGRRLRTWLDALGEVEALASLAVIRHDHPEWALPELVEGRGNPSFMATEMGHPLLDASAVPNDLKFGSPQNILLITGSNMSGKSTLLRTAGINLVLAYAGTAVCAGTFACSRMEIYTCMRVSDNLEKNISSFYAELLRIKMMVQAVEEGKIGFFLLDEIFKGTNSVDRHTGAKALIQKLSKEKVLGLISTHDLELGDLAKQNNKIRNYHFQEYYQNDQIRFDYKLRPGVSTTRNAVYLMKMAGIEM